MKAECRNLGGGDYIFEVTDYTGSSFEEADKTLLEEFERWKRANTRLKVKSVITLPGDAFMAVTEKRSLPNRKK